MVALERLDEDSLRELSRRSDALGVLSVYVDVDPRPDPTLRATGIDLKNRYRELQRRIGESDEAQRSRDVLAALDRVRSQVEGLAARPETGRSRIAFVALDSDWALHLESSLPVANRLVLDDGPFLHPLLELLDEGRAAGVVVLSANGARMLEWRLGSLQELRTLEQDYIQAPHERAGQIGGGPPGQFNSPKREQRQSREREHSERFLDQAIEAAAALAEERGWERILVSGGDRMTEAAISRFPQQLRDIAFADTRMLSGFDDSTLAATVTDWAHEQHGDRETQLLSRVRDAVGAGGGVLGLSEVAVALTAGRVAHLVYDPEIRYVGTVGADGALYGGDEVGSGGGMPEPRLTERLIDRALETNAKISPVDGAAAGALSDANGIAALLRW